MIECNHSLTAQSAADIAAVKDVEQHLAKFKQVQIEIEQHIHDGVYSRTAFVPAGIVISGAEIIIQTTLIISGDASILTPSGWARLTGYVVLEAVAGRKQVFFAHSDTYITMVFKTNADTFEEAEREFTSEPNNLQTRSNAKGEMICQV